MSKLKFVLILMVSGFIISCGADKEDDDDKVATLNIKNLTNTAVHPATYDEIYMSKDETTNTLNSFTSAPSCKGSVIARDILPGTSKSVTTSMCSGFY